MILGCPTRLHKKFQNFSLYSQTFVEKYIEVRDSRNLVSYKL